MEVLEVNNIEEEFKGARLHDQRLTKRLISIARHFSEHPEAHIPEASQSRSETKAAYRFFQNDKVTPEGILSAHRDHVLKRVGLCEVVYLIEDSGFFNFNSHAATQGLGSIGKWGHNHDEVQGLIMHTAMAYTPEGTPLGVVHQKIWSRKNIKKNDSDYELLTESENNKWLLAMKQMIKEEIPLTTHIIHVCDRESDCAAYIYQATEYKLDFVIRAKRNRIIADQYKRRIIDYLEGLPEVGRFGLELTFRPRDPKHKTRYLQSQHESVEMKVYADRVKLSVKDSQKENIELLAIWVKPVGLTKATHQQRDLEWLLLTPLKANTFDEIMNIIEIYRHRWSIEMFHKILKSGFKAEECKLSDAKRLECFLTVLSVVAWRYQMILQLGRELPEIPSELVLTEDEWRVVCMHANPTQPVPKTSPPLAEMVRHIAEMGGFIGRKTQNPGPLTFWRGMKRLDAMVEFYQRCMKPHEKDVGS